MIFRSQMGFFAWLRLMADYRLSAKIIGRSSGRSSVAAAAYRAGQRLHDERTDLDHDYTRKRGILHSQILAPDNAPDWMKDRAKLWNAVEAVERRKDAQLAREIQLSLPHELDENQNRNMVLDFVQTHFVDRGMIADIAIHAPDRTSDQRNIHAHVMLTMRELTSGGFGDKNRDWNTSEQLTEWRKSWADRQNTVFQELGMEQRVDHRSLADQGVDREPTQHLGPVANDMEKNGRGSRIGDENRERQQRNAERAALAQAAADTARDLAREKQAQDERVNTEKAAQQSQQLNDQIEMGRRHSIQQNLLDADIAKRNDERRLALEAQQQQLESNLAADGWRKLMRDLLGKTRQDLEQLEATRLNLENIRMREAQERDALAARQEQERQAQASAQQERQQAYAQQLADERAAALAATTAQKSQQQQPTPANDGAKPSWTRSHAPEQDNPSQGVQSFREAASASPEPSEAKQQAIEEHKARIRERLQTDRGRSREGFERD